MLQYSVTKRFGICIDINIEISLDHYTYLFTSRIFRLALEITSLLRSIFSCKWLMGGGGGGGGKKNNIF